MYVGWTLVAFILNMFCVKLLPFLERGALCWSLLGFAIIVITVLSCSSGHYQPAKNVFATWTNETGVSGETRDISQGANSLSGLTEWRFSWVFCNRASDLLHLFVLPPRSFTNRRMLPLT